MLFLLAATDLAPARATRLIFGGEWNERSTSFLARECQVVVGQYSIALPRFTYLNRADVVLLNLRLQDKPARLPDLSPGLPWDGPFASNNASLFACSRRTVGTDSHLAARRRMRL